MSAPLVSVLVTTYNHAAYVEQALDSVRAQDWTDYEMIITDDASTDDTAAVVRAWLERTGTVAQLDVHERNVGICAARNRALARARGTLVCSLSGDDWYEPDRLSRQAPFLAAQPAEVGAVYSDVHVVDADGTVLPPSYLVRSRPQGSPSGDVFADLQAASFLPALGVMVRRSAIDAVGGYDESLAFEDWDMWLRLADRFAFVHLDGVVASWRTLPTSLYHSGFATPRLQASVARLHAKWLDRDDVARRVSARWIRDAVPTIARTDRREARRLLQLVADVPADDNVPWWAVERALAVPGSGRLAGSIRRARRSLAAAVAAERGAWRSGRRLRW